MALGRGSDAFDLAGDGEIGVVCVHGFTGTPFEMRYLGEQLAHAGFTVHGVRLPGHGTQVADLAMTRWTDWARAVEDAFDMLARRCKRVAVVGQSLGGLLALHLASRRPDVAAVGSLATPLWFEGTGARVMGAIRTAKARGGVVGKLLSRIEYLPKVGGSDCRDRHACDENPGYRSMPVRSLGELVALMELTRESLERVTQPVLVLHARQDHTAPVACAAMIAERTRAVRTRILDRSYHVITIDVERAIVAAEVGDFLRRHITCAT